jgi:CTP:molybdopterin cytidylyltransferase MocA
MGRRMVLLRQPRVMARVALALWMVWAVLVWNVVFDHVIVVAGREYIAAATQAAFSTTVPHRYENMDDWMRPAVARGIRLASLSALAIAVSGVVLVRASTRAARQHGEERASCA